MFIGTAGQEAVIGGNLLELHYTCCDNDDDDIYIMMKCVSRFCLFCCQAGKLFWQVQKLFWQWENS